MGEKCGWNGNPERGKNLRRYGLKYIHYIHLIHMHTLHVYINTCIPTLYTLYTKVKVIYYDRQSPGQSVLVSGTHLGPATNFSHSLIIFYTVSGLLMWGALSDEKSGL
jgi:hypothetical protein